MNKLDEDLVKIVRGVLKFNIQGEEKETDGVSEIVVGAVRGWLEANDLALTGRGLRRIKK